ncbi:MAG: hypothetical protein WA839_13255 [Flavobacteriaceae bacterium]|tara:strand:+ start:2614 stop:2931 length:318 start_codon:yes stop_codon:yes gene_type:complete
MKINFYILLILLLAFSFSNAQSEKTSIEIDSNNVISVSEMNNEVAVVFNNILNVESKKESLLIDASKVKASIARTNSDIRTYFNRERKVDNIKMLFPEINKAVKA